jgi:Family of unknown function (DUF6174)
MSSAKNILILSAFLAAAAMLVLSCSTNREQSGALATNSNIASNSNEPDATELDRMKALWESRQIFNYRMIVQARISSNSARSVAIEVRDGKSISISKLESTDKGSVEPYKQYDTVGKIFDVIERTSKSKHDVLTVSYSTMHGYPTEVKADIDRQSADDEFSIMIVGLFSK